MDTGWLGTQGIDEDARASGAHDTCPLGEGCVNIRGVIAAPQEVGYEGW